MSDDGYLQVLVECAEGGAVDAVGNVLAAACGTDLEDSILQHLEHVKEEVRGQVRHLADARRPDSTPLDSGGRVGGQLTALGPSRDGDGEGLWARLSRHVDLHYSVVESFEAEGEADATAARELLELLAKGKVPLEFVVPVGRVLAVLSGEDSSIWREIESGSDDDLVNVAMAVACDRGGRKGSGPVPVTLLLRSGNEDNIVKGLDLVWSGRGLASFDEVLSLLSHEGKDVVCAVPGALVTLAQGSEQTSRAKTVCFDALARPRTQDASEYAAEALARIHRRSPLSAGAFRGLLDGAEPRLIRDIANAIGLILLDREMVSDIWTGLTMPADMTRSVTGTMVAGMAPDPDFAIEIKQGERVVHPHFGAGTVTWVVQSEAQVDFDDGQSKIFLLAHAPLTLEEARNPGSDA